MTKEEVIKKIKDGVPLYYLVYKLPTSIYTLSDTTNAPWVTVKDVDDEGIVTIENFYSTEKATFSKEIALEWLKDSLDNSLKTILKVELKTLREVQIVLYVAKKYDIELSTSIPVKILREMIQETKKMIVDSKAEIEQYKKNIEYYKSLTIDKNEKTLKLNFKTK